MATTDRLDRSVTYRLRALYKIADKMSGDLSREKLGLTFPEATVIGVVGTFGPQTIMDISQRCNLDKSQTSRTVEALSGREMLTRADNTNDGRSVVIDLTAAGRKIFKKVGPAMDQRDEDLYGALAEAELEAFSLLLDKILENNGWPEKN